MKEILGSEKKEGDDEGKYLGNMMDKQPRESMQGKGTDETVVLTPPPSDFKWLMLRDQQKASLTPKDKAEKASLAVPLYIPSSRAPYIYTKEVHDIFFSLALSTVQCLPSFQYDTLAPWNSYLFRQTLKPLQIFRKLCCNQNL